MPTASTTSFIASGMNYPERYMVNSVKLNDRGQRFVDAEFVLGVEPRKGGVVTPWFELDASGKDKGHRMRPARRGRVAIWGARGTRVSGDLRLDGDGDLDIVTNEFNAAPMVLVSNLTREDAGALPRGEADRDGVEPQTALGAVVKVTAGGTTYTKVMDGNSGYLSHSLYPLYFGLGAAESVDSIEVTVAVRQEADGRWAKMNSDPCEVREPQAAVNPAKAAGPARRSARWESAVELHSLDHRPVAGFRVGRRRGT